ncbi:hypothetical protein Glove_464g16 [Diversispora epigaea]|uniref:Uncharacterized protein n=1 Tax=Diversispora epigaea TaxID=1348612 RepID=A0A397GR67_9GLOM|nr:hypothetical protein Glove_464g16 [Diversispora epigaea]
MTYDNTAFIIENYDIVMTYRYYNSSLGYGNMFTPLLTNEIKFKSLDSNSRHENKEGHEAETKKGCETGETGDIGDIDETGETGGT